MMTMDMRVKKILGHQRNIQRYCRLLATDLTDLERQYLHKRIAEEHAALDRLSMQMNQPPTLTNERPYNPAIGPNPLPPPASPPRMPGSSSRASPASGRSGKASALADDAFQAEFVR
jgi:hypothetical protein